MSFSSLGIGASALYAAQRAVEVAAHNVANANTAGFTRQRLAIQTSLPTPGTPSLRGDGMRGTGVEVLSIDRLRDRLADVAYRSEAGSAGAATAKSSTLSRAESVLGAYGEGMSQALSRFVASWDELSLRPDDPAGRAGVLAAGEQLAGSLRSSAEQLQSVVQEVGLRMRDQVGELNGLLTSVSRLNVAIQDAVVSGQSPNDLRDQRDLALDRIVTLTGARVVPGQGEHTDVLLGDVALVSGIDAREVVLVLDEDDGTPSLSVDGDPLAASGELGGYTKAITGDLRLTRDGLNDIATGLVELMVRAHGGARDLDGAAGGPFFVGDDARSLEVDPALLDDPRLLAASRGGARADGGGALDIAAALRGEAAVGEATVGEAMRAFSGGLGQAASNAARDAKTASLGLAGAEITRAGVNGVNVDEEMVDLVKFQHQYSAATKVISVVDEMLQRIIDRIGS